MDNGDGERILENETFHRNLPTTMPTVCLLKVKGYQAYFYFLYEIELGYLHRNALSI